LGEFPAAWGESHFYIRGTANTSLAYGVGSFIKHKKDVVFGSLDEAIINEDFIRFLSLLECNGKIDLTIRPSSMLYYQKAFSKEWRKINYD